MDHLPGRLSHASIVTGPDPEGRRQRVLELAAALLCRAEGPRPCRRCDDCRRVFAGIHPDCITLERQTDAKGQLRREIQVDQIRDLGADAAVLPNQADIKVYILEDADAMNAAAQNALLKVIEEPQSACFVFLCLSRLSLLPTVRSRCAVYSLRAEEAEENPEIAEMCSAFPSAMGDEHSLIMFFSKAADLKRQDFAVFLLCCKKEVHRLLLKGENTDVLLKIYDLICSFEDDLQYNPNLFALCCTLSGQMWEILKKQKG